MLIIERMIIDILLNFTSIEQLNTFMAQPRNVAIIVGALVAIAAALPGVFLLLRKMALTSDAISHTVLLGIVVAFMIMVGLGANPDLNSPLLLIGAAAAGVVTVMLTEAIYRSGLVKADAALGLAFPFLFALAIILISHYVDNVHLDEDAVLVGEIGVAYANINVHCYEQCDSITITPDDARAEFGRRCTNCSAGGLSPRDPEAEFETYCINCGTHTAAEAWRERLIDSPPVQVRWPRAITTMGLIALVNIIFITLFYKELKLVSFDEALAGALGFRPTVLHYTLMILVSLTAVAAFDAVGSILVVAFFIIPVATAYLLTDRLSLIIILSPIFGIAGVYWGYDLARGYFWGLPLDGVLQWLDSIIELNGYTTWNTSISAAMVLMLAAIFVVVWMMSPRYGLIATIINRRLRRLQFEDQMLLVHLYNHLGGEREAEELALETLHQHLQWPRMKLERVLARVRLRQLAKIQHGQVYITQAGIEAVRNFAEQNLPVEHQEQIIRAVGD